MLLLTLGLGSFTACEENNGDDDPINVGIGDCNVTNSIRDMYEEDAIRLAVRLQQAAGINDIQIPSNLIDRTLGALAAVYRSEYIARDSVTSVYDIHTLNAPSYNTLTVEVSTDTTAYPWIAQWMDGNRLTGNDTVDQLMNIYGLDRTNFITLSTGSAAIIESDTPINMAGLAAAFENISGVVLADFEDNAGDGNDIQIVDHGTYMEVIYSLGYDSPFEVNTCLSDCVYRRSWMFNVFDDCSAAYVGVEGDPAP